MALSNSWKRVVLREVADVVTGRTPSPAVQAYWQGTLPFVTPGDLTQPIFDGNAARSLSDSGRRIARLIPPASTLVTCIGSSVGKMALTMVECTTNQQINAVTARPGVDPYFLHSALAANGERIRQLAGNTAVPLVTKSQLSQFPVLLPPLSFQKRVGALLRACDVTTGAISALVECKRAFKRALMNDLLIGRRRFPEFVGDAWPMRKLEDIAAINPESLLESTDPNKEIRYIEISALRGGTIALPDHAIPFGDAPSRARRIATSNDVLFSTVRPYLQGFAIVDEGHNEDLVCSTGFAVIRPNNVVDARFILENLYSSRVSRQTNAALVGSSYPALNEGDVRRLTIPWPSAEEREKIAGVLWAARMEIAELEQLATLYSALKRGLMQRLLSGEIEIPEHLTAGTAAAEASDDDS